MRAALVLLLGAMVGLPVGHLGASADTQLGTVRSRIRALEARLATMERERSTARAEREALDAEMELAQARVEELELVLSSTRDEAERLENEASRLFEELRSRREMVAAQLEMVALLGRPGPLQLLHDAASGGDLDRMLGTVSVLTVGQVHLLEEYEALRRRRAARLGELSRLLQRARREASSLLERRRELEETRQRVSARLTDLERRAHSAEVTLEDLRERERALARLLTTLAQRERIGAGEDIRRFRGALPWPVEGRVARSFGRHYLPKYATYTVCNGVWLEVESGAGIRASFDGTVAYAGHFKGYGNMVVLAHGHEVYSLVAGLASIHVRREQRVSMGATLGQASPGEPDGNVYVEFRVGRSPQDPTRWLELMEGRS